MPHNRDSASPFNASTNGLVRREAGSEQELAESDVHIVGLWNIGTDIVDIARIRSLLESPGHLRWFSASEVEYCMGKSHPERHFAGRLAAKEAIFKALALPGGVPVPWSQIEVLSRPRVAPEVVLHGELRDCASRSGITVRVSISHCSEYATATALTVPSQPTSDI